MANLGDVRTRIQMAIMLINEGRTKDAVSLLRKAEGFLDDMIGDKYEDRYEISDLGRDWY